MKKLSKKKFFKKTRRKPKDKFGCFCFYCSYGNSKKWFNIKKNGHNECFSKNLNDLEK